MTVGDIIQELFEFDLNTEVYEYDDTGGLTPFDGVSYMFVKSHGQNINYRVIKTDEFTIKVVTL